MSPDRTAVLHIVDTLEPGGLEHVAVNLVNHLPRDRWRPFLCTTRREGMLAARVASDVGRLRLNRRTRLDVRAVWRLAAFLKDHRIGIVHAHGTSLFVAQAASAICPAPAIIWHDHWGASLIGNRPRVFYRAATRRLSAVIAVNRSLADWSRQHLDIEDTRVWYIPNFSVPGGTGDLTPTLPGERRLRVVCLANFRRQKDHHTLIEAFQAIVQRVDAHLILVGLESDRGYVATVRAQVAAAGLGDRVSFLGQRDDIHAILSACSVGVLSSASEGLPLALIEYGLAELPVVATDVGQCAEVLNGGNAGVLVSPGAPSDLARAVTHLLETPPQRRKLGVALRRHVEAHYSPQRVVEQVTEVYDSVH